MKFIQIDLGIPSSYKIDTTISTDFKLINSKISESCLKNSIMNENLLVLFYKFFAIKFGFTTLFNLILKKDYYIDMDSYIKLILFYFMMDNNNLQNKTSDKKLNIKNNENAMTDFISHVNNLFYNNQQDIIPLRFKCPYNVK